MFGLLYTAFIITLTLLFRLLKVGEASSSLTMTIRGLGGDSRDRPLIPLTALEPLAILPSSDISDVIATSTSNTKGALTTNMPIALLRFSSDGRICLHSLRPFGPTHDKMSILQEKTATLFNSEIQLSSLYYFGPHVEIRLGGLVIARSVKYLGMY